MTHRLPPAGNILLVRLRSMGDILFTRPAVHLIRESWPDAKITFLVSRELAPLLEGFQDINEAIALDRAVYRGGNLKAMVVSTFSLLRRLRRDQFGLVVDFQGYGETALLTWLTRAPHRWGNVYRGGRRWAYTRGVPRNNQMHPAEWNLSLLHQCGLRPGRIRNEYVPPAWAVAEARRFVAAHQLVPDCPTLFIQPFTSSPQKNWPLDRFVAVARHWKSQGRQVIFGGGPAEGAALEPARQAGFPVAAGVPLLVTAGLLKLSTLALGGDTGALHLAVAMGKRVVMIMASLAPGSTHPFQHPGWAITASERQPVVRIGLAAVVEACSQAWADAGSHGALQQSHRS